MADLTKTQLALDFGDFVYEVVRMATAEEYGDAMYFERLTASRKAIFSKFGLGLLCYVKYAILTISHKSLKNRPFKVTIYHFQLNLL